MITVTFCHPTTEARKTLEVDISSTAKQCLCRLAASDFLPDSGEWENGSLYIKASGATISGFQTLAEGGATDNCVIHVLDSIIPGGPISNDNFRRERLKSDFYTVISMVDPNGAITAVRPIEGQRPYFYRYEIDLHVRTFVFPKGANAERYSPVYCDRHTIDVYLPPEYPNRTDNKIPIRMRPPIPYHPNWHIDPKHEGYFCYGDKWNPRNDLKCILIRLIRTLKYDTTLLAGRTITPANSFALTWYNKNVERGFFPCSNVRLPL